MPDAYGNFKGIAVNGAAWDRIFGTAFVPSDAEFDAKPADLRCPWQYPAGECPISDCLSNDDNPTSDR